MHVNWCGILFGYLQHRNKLIDKLGELSGTKAKQLNSEQNGKVNNRYYLGTTHLIVFLEQNQIQTFIQNKIKLFEE